MVIKRKWGMAIATIPVALALLAAIGMSASIARANSDQASNNGSSETGAAVVIEINGAKLTVNEGDVLATGSLIEIDKAPLWAALETAAAIASSAVVASNPVVAGGAGSASAAFAPPSASAQLETAALELAALQILSLPDGFCDFGELKVQSSFVAVETGAYSERLLFYANEDCELKFGGKQITRETVATVAANQPLAQASAQGAAGASGTASAQSGLADPKRTTHDEDAECKVDDTSIYKVYPEELEDSEITNVVRSHPLTEGDGISYFGLEVRARMRVLDRGNLRNENNLPVFDNDCTGAMTVTDAQFSYTTTGDIEVKNYEGACSVWRFWRFLPIVSRHFWEWDTKVKNNCSRRNLNNSQLGILGIGTEGVYRINESRFLLLELVPINSPSPLIEILEHNGIFDYELVDTDGVRLSANATYNPEGIGIIKPYAGYSCNINKLPKVTTSLTGGETLSVTDLIEDNSDIRAIIAPKEGTFDTALECAARYYTNQGSSGNTPIAAQPDNRNLASLDEYVQTHFPGIGFSKSITVSENQPLTYSVERYTALPEIEVAVYNYEWRTRAVYNYEWRTRAVYNYAWRSRAVYNYEVRTRTAYNYEWRTRSVYNYRTQRYCARRGGFLWLSCLEWRTRTVRVSPYTERYRVRVAPYTERYWVRVAPYNEWYKARVAPYTERYRLRVHPYIEWYQTRVAPFTELLTPHEWRTISNVPAADVIRTGYKPDRNIQPLTYGEVTRTITVDTDYNGAILDCDSDCQAHRGALEDAPIVADNGKEGNDNKTVTGDDWEDALDQLKENRDYDRDSVLGDPNQLTTLEGVKVAFKQKRTIAPLDYGNWLTLSCLLDEVISANGYDDGDDHDDRKARLRRSLRPPSSPAPLPSESLCY